MYAASDSIEAYIAPSPSALSIDHPPPARLRNLFSDKSVNARSGSSSSGSLTDWDSSGAISHSSTVLRRHHQDTIPTLPSRLSIRSELSTSSGSSSNITNFSNIQKRKPIRKKKDEASGGCSMKTVVELHHVPSQHNNASEQMHRRLNNKTKELTPSFSDVYLERNTSLGLAPSLSKLLGEEDYLNCEQKNESAAARNMVRNNIVVGHSQTTNWLQTETEYYKRDEGDGRSIAGSQCSQTSGSNRIRRKAPPPPV